MTFIFTCSVESANHKFNINFVHHTEINSGEKMHMQAMNTNTLSIQPPTGYPFAEQKPMNQSHKLLLCIRSKLHLKMFIKSRI